MINKDLVKLINEEISDFDFLGNEKYTKEKESVNLLNNEDFQKQIICDSLLRRKEKFKTLDVVESNFSGDWEENGYLTINYIIELAYKYDMAKEPANIGLHFHGDKISYSLDSNQSTSGDNMTAPVDEAWFNEINWDDFQVDLFSVDDDTDVEFKAFNRAPKRIKDLFIKDFLRDFISEWAGKGMGTPADYDNINKTGYC